MNININRLIDDGDFDDSEVTDILYSPRELASIVIQGKKIECEVGSYFEFLRICFPTEEFHLHLRKQILRLNLSEAMGVESMQCKDLIEIRGERWAWGVICGKH